MRRRKPTLRGHGAAQDAGQGAHDGAKGGLGGHAMILVTPA
jgi:hypothetical protein